MVPSITSFLQNGSPPQSRGAFVLSALRRAPSARRHPNGTVQTDDLTVEHRVFDDVHRECPVLVGITQSGRVRHLLSKRLLRLLWQRTQQRGLEQPGCDG